MGMAASQSRYLALTARKTNTEYEGQQINQARTALANQSANLFNQLLALEVPTAPSTTDYTELQYSYSDGSNDSVLDSWEQLSTADPNYNYIVNHYYYSNVYTGAQKLLQNPEVTEKTTTTKTDYKTIATSQVGGTPTIRVRIDSSTGVAEIQANGTTLANATYLPLSSVSSDTKLENAKKDVEDTYGITLTDNDYGYQDADGTWHFLVQNEITNMLPDGSNLNDYTTTFDPGAVGNCPLTELTLPLTDDQDADLSQIIKDVNGTNMDQYLSFDPVNGLSYSGSGVYTFEMNGQTYYTCRADLYNSMQTQDEYGKPIENQEKLAYYNASYVATRMEETEKALLETDGNGRFKSVKLENDSVVYSLNTETVTDEDAYQDAMNEYNYQIAQYEKTIADINAKTSIIQQEDRTLELRLKQLDTEQNALSTEMEAVKKVIKDNVEKTFKTFSD